MRNYIFSLILGTCTLLMVSCDDFLTTQPLNQVTNDNYWKSEADVRAELNAAYAHLQEAYKIGYWYWFEARSDNMIGSTNGSYSYQGICFNNLTSSYPCCNWNVWYKMVSVANYAIHYIPTIQNAMTTTRQNHLLSEAYFLRAFAYFNLYRIWGDVPLLTEPTITISDVNKPSRTEMAVVMAQIVKDIEKAAELVDNTQRELYFYSPGALYALATDVAMWNKDYDKALSYSKKLIDLNQYTLEGAEFKRVLAEGNTTDNIWTLDWSYSSNGQNSVVVMVNSSGNVLIPTKEIYEQWTAEETLAGAVDLRRVATLDSQRVGGYGKNHVKRFPSSVVRSWKWSPGEFVADQSYYYECPITIYRYADILLLRAEAFNKKNQMDDAVTLVNKVRARAGLPELLTSSFASQDALEDAILQERKFELYLEGKRWFDLVRTNHVEKVMNAFYEGYIKTYGGTGYTLYDPAKPWQKFWPVHRNIINENTNITQTGDY